MAVHLEVFFEGSKLPTFAAWAEAIQRQGFPLTFPEPVKLDKHSGFLPAVLGDEETGFEFSIYRLTSRDNIPEEVFQEGYRPDTVAEFRFHEMHESRAAAVGAAVLASLTNGMFFDPQGGDAVSANDAISQAKEELKEAAEKEAAESSKPQGRIKPAEWAKIFEDAMHQVHPEYRLNTEFHGNLVECVRRASTGLLLSQNCGRSHDTWTQCFAVLFTSKRLSGVLNSPFIIGSMFDHNSTVSHAYNRDYRSGMKWQVAPKEWHSEHRPTRRGAQEWTVLCANSAERYLYPLYVGWLIRGADRLLSLFRDAATFMEQWKVSTEVLKQPVQEKSIAALLGSELHLDKDPEDWEDYMLPSYNALLLADSNGFPAIDLLRHRLQAINTKCSDILLGSKKLDEIPDQIRNVSLFVWYAEDFAALKEELPRVIRAVELLKVQHPPAAPGNPDSPKKSWWKIW